MAGQIAWIDLTVEHAEEVRDFYKAVVGWEASGVSMGDYDDFNMSPPGADPIAGVCHAKGTNAGIPPVWMLYVTVDDLTASIAAVEELGGEVLRAPSEGGKSCIVRDPAGAVLTLYQA